MLTLPAPTPGALAAPGAAALPFAVACFLVLALQFGPLVGLLGFRLTAIDEFAWIGSVRDAAAIALAALAVPAGLKLARQRELPPSARWALWLAAVYGLVALVTMNGLLLTALNLRRLVLVPLVLAAVMVIPWSPRQLDRLFALIFSTSIAVALFGVAERLGPEGLWSDVLDIQAYTLANNFDRFGATPFQDSGRFFSTDLEFLTGGPVRRMVATYLEPTTLAAGMAALLAMALARRARGYRATLAIGLAVLCGVATVSKGFVAYLLVLLAWRLLGVPSPRHLLVLVVLVVLGCVAALAASELHLEGPFAHVAGLISALDYLRQGNWFGEGIGAAGNFSDSGAEVGEESGLGNVIGQVGLVAVLSLVWLRSLGRDVLRAAAVRGDPGGPWLASWLLFWTVTYVFSASSLGVGGNALGFMLLGLYLNPASGRVAR